MKTQTQHEWTKVLNAFSEQNVGRTTRMGVFESDGDIINDYWLEDGLPLVGIDLETRKETPSVQITVGNYTREIKDAIKIVFRLGLDGDEDGIDVISAGGQTTILRFETESDIR